MEEVRTENNELQVASPEAVATASYEEGQTIGEDGKNPGLLRACAGGIIPR